MMQTEFDLHALQDERRREAARLQVAREVRLISETMMPAPSSDTRSERRLWSLASALTGPLRRRSA
jgi:hypothetical protein